MGVASLLVSLLLMPFPHGDPLDATALWNYANRAGDSPQSDRSLPAGPRTMAPAADYFASLVGPRRRLGAAPAAQVAQILVLTDCLRLPVVFRCIHEAAAPGYRLRCSSSQTRLRQETGFFLSARALCLSAGARRRGT